MEAKRNENAKKENVNSNDKCNSGSKKKKKILGGLADSQKTFESLDGIRDNL